MKRAAVSFKILTTQPKVLDLTPKIRRFRWKKTGGFISICREQSHEIWILEKFERSHNKNRRGLE